MNCHKIILNNDLQADLQGYVEKYLNSQKIAKENSLARGLSWLDLATEKYDTLDEFILISKDSPEKFSSVLDFLGTLIDLNLLNEMKIEDG